MSGSELEIEKDFPNDVINDRNTLQFPQNHHQQQRRHSSHNTNSRYYNSISDDSLNRSRRQSYAGIYPTSSSPPIRRLSASSLLEERCLMGYQIPIDPRYRDTRPIARSASSLYNMSKEVSLSTHNLTNPQGGGMMFQTAMPEISIQQHEQPVEQQFGPLRQRARSASNANITNTPPPSIYIEEYMEPGEQSSANKTNSQESFTNFVYTEVHQPLNEEGIASVSNTEEIPFIDDGSPTEEEKPYVPLEPFQQLNRGIIGNKKPLNLNTQRKTVSFDLEDIASKESTVEILTNRKFHTHDALSKYCSNTSSSSNHNSNESLKQDSNSSLDKQGKMSLIQKIRRELNSYRSTSSNDANTAAEADSGGSNSNSQRSSSESIERMPLLTQRFREVTLKPRRELNSIRSTSGGGITAGQQAFKYQQQQNRFFNHTQINRDFSKQLPPPQPPQMHHHSIVKTQNVNIFSKLNNERKQSLNPTQTEYVPISLQKPKSLSQNNLLSSDCSDEMPEFSKTWGEGKVKEMADFFAKNKDFKLQPFQNQKILSKSTSDLMESKKSGPKKPLLTEPEQTDILKQLKEWSIFGLEGRDFDIKLKISQEEQPQQSSNTETQQRISFNANLINNNNNCSNINNNDTDNYLKQCTNSVIETSSTPCKLSLSTKLNVNCDPCPCFETKNCCSVETCTLLKQQPEPYQHKTTCIKTNNCCKCHLHKSSSTCTTSSSTCNHIQQQSSAPKAAKTLQRCGTLKLSSKTKTVRSIKRKQQQLQQNNQQHCPEENTYKPFNSPLPSCKLLLSLASSDSLTTTSSTTSNSTNLCSSTCPHCCLEFENHNDYNDVIKDNDTDDDIIDDDGDIIDDDDIDEDKHFHHNLDPNETS
ncbi:ras guanine nucleotide exchange factor Q-like [Calliphora vicina]|uniref:ras guanine nucleotide exchange factor Q-like n=1 Tax=Calliphora vicina TaxID=7373 RepID=UPI00325C0C2F